MLDSDLTLAEMEIFDISSTVSVTMWPIRPLVDHRVTGGYNDPQTDLSFTGGACDSLDIRNRCASDPPVLADITITNGYLSTNWNGPFVLR